MSAGRPRTATSAATCSRCCWPRATSRASRSPITSCATSSCRWCSPAMRRPPTRWPGRSSACCARRARTTRLRELVRSGDRPAAQEYVEATIHEGMRNRPVIPMIVRLVMRPWRFGDYVVPARTPVARQHHRAAPPPRRVSRTPRASPRSDLSASSPAPTRGSRSAAGSGAAWGRRWRWPSSASCSRRSRDGPTWWRPIPRPSGPRMRNVTMIPRGGCLVTGRAPLSGLTEVYGRR